MRMGCLLVRQHKDPKSQFMHRFVSRGVIANHPVQSGWTVKRGQNDGLDVERASQEA